MLALPLFRKGLDTHQIAARLRAEYRREVSEATVYNMLHREREAERGHSVKHAPRTVRVRRSFA